MSDQKKNNKHTEEEDLELIKRSFLCNSCKPISAQITQIEIKNKIEKDHNKEFIESKIKLFEQGYNTLIEEISNHAVEGFYSMDTNIKPIPIENFKLIPEKLQAIKQTLSEGGTPNIKMLGFSSDVQLLFYEIATHFYEEALYEKSINTFSFLTMVNPKVQSFWIGLALAYEKNLNIDKAIENFEAAIKSEPSDFTPYYGIIRCCETIKDFKKLDELLESAKQNEAIKEQVEEVLEYLKMKK